MLEFTVVAYVYGMIFVTHTGLSREECTAYVERSKTVVLSIGDDKLKLPISEQVYKACEVGYMA